MDFLSTTTPFFNNPSPTAGNALSSAGETTTDNNPILRPQKRPVGRPKGSKNKRKTVVEIPARESTDNNHILRHVKRPVGRPKGSKNKRKTVPPPLETEPLNYTAVVEIPSGEPTDDNHTLRPPKRSVGRPKGSKNKPKTAPPPPDEINSATVIEIPAGANIVQSLFQFCCRHQVSLTVLNGSGQLANIVPYDPRTNSSIVPGPFPILSLSGTVKPTPQPLSDAINSPEIIFPLTALLSSPNGAPLGAMVGKSAMAASMVAVAAVMTTVLNHYVMSKTVLDDRANKSDEEIAPASILPPQNLQFSEFYSSCSSGDLMKNPIQSYDNQQENDHEEHDLMKKKSNNADELMIDEDIWRCEDNFTPALRVEPYRY